MARVNVDQYERARRAWSILVECAQNRQPTTYGQLAARMGLHPRVCRFFLGLIQDYCSAHNLPPLQSLVLNKRTRVPGGGYIATQRDYRQIEEAHNRVFSYLWNTIGVPF